MASAWAAALLAGGAVIAQPSPGGGKEAADQATAGGSDPAQTEQAAVARVEAARQRAGENSLPYAFALQAHARSLLALGNFKDAEATSRQALSILTALRGEGDPHALTVLAQLGYIITRAGRFAEAEPMLRRSWQGLLAANGPEDRQTLTAEGDLGFNLISQGRDREAETLLRQVLAGRTRVLGAEDGETLTTQVQLGRALQEEHNLGGAETIYRRVVDLRRAQRGDNDAQTLVAISDLADVLREEGRPGEAETLHRLCLQGRTKLLGERHPDTLLSMDFLARDLVPLGKLDEADSLIRRALALQTEVLGETHPNTLGSMNTLAYVLRRENKLAEAEAVMRRALELRTKTLGPRHFATLSTMSSLATDIAAQGRRAEAEQMLQQVVDTRRELLGEGHAGLVSDLVQLGYVRLAQPDRAALAVMPLRQAVAVLRRARANSSFSPRADIEISRETVNEAGVFRMLADADWAAMQAHPEQSEMLRSEAFLALQDAMAGTVTQSFALAAARSAAQQAGDDLGKLADQRQVLADQWKSLGDRQTGAIGQQTSAASDQASLSSQMAGVEAQIRQIDDQLRARAPAYFALTRPEPLSVDDTKALLGPDEAVLMVVPSNFGTHLVALTHDGISWVRSDPNRFAIRTMVNALRSQLNPEAVARNNRPFSRALSYKLYGAMVAPVAEALAGRKQLFVAADGALASLPFQVLVAAPPSGSDDDPAAMQATKWFGEDHALLQLPSLQTLQFLRTTKRAHGGNTNSFEGFGNPTLQGAAATRGGPMTGPGTAAISSVAQLASLPGTATEIEKIASALDAPSSTVHLGQQATEPAVQAMDLSHTRIIALATHGLLPGQLQGQDEPGLVFTPPTVPGPADDGYLSASEITQLKLDADLVILSACNSGGGEGEGTPPLSGLARAFFYAGARGLLVSHWPVYDDVAPRITVELIAQRRANPTMSLAEALQRAVRKVREDKDDTTLAFPSAWGPFVLVGDWRP